MEQPIRIRTIDGLRGLAALLVVFDHTVGSSWGLGGWTAQNHGITAFALLAGFLLSGKFLRARLDRAERPAATSFLRARAARIFPGYWVALAGAAAVIGLENMGSGDLWRVITLTQTLDSGTPFEGHPITWSLSLFLCFYLALPAWAWWRSRSDRFDLDASSLLRREIAWLFGLIVAAGVVRTFALTGSLAQEPIFTLPGRMDWFAICGLRQSTQQKLCHLLSRVAPVQGLAGATVELSCDPVELDRVVNGQVGALREVLPE